MKLRLNLLPKTWLDDRTSAFTIALSFPAAGCATTIEEMRIRRETETDLKRPATPRFNQAFLFPLETEFECGPINLLKYFSNRDQSGF